MAGQLGPDNVAILAASVIAHRTAASHGGASKDAGGLDALFAAILAASGAAGANGPDAGTAIKTPHPDRANNVATRLTELLNGSARVAVKAAASGTGIAKPADAADTVTAKDKPAPNTAPKTENESAIPAAPFAITPDTAGIKKVAQTPDAQVIGATAKEHGSAPSNPAPPHAPAQAAGAQASGKIEDAAAKPATPDLPAQSSRASQAADAKPQAAANAGRDKNLQAALAALQAGADKAAHQNIPAEKTGEVLPLQTVAAAVKADGQGGNSASSNAGGHDTPPQDHHDSVPAKPQPAETAAAPLPANSNADALTPNPNAVAQTAPTHVSATLEVAPQSAAHPAVQSGPDNQAVPLSNLGALAVSIAAKSLGGAKQFDIGLHPVELGSIHVRLTVDHLGTAQAHLSAETPQTLALLQRDSHTLERALKDAGLNLAGNGLNFSLKGQDRQSGSGPQPNGRGRTLSLSAVASTAPADMASTTSLAPDGVRLDIRV